MAVREYIGARYVPVFGYKDETGTTQMQWVNTRMYEPLVVMQNQGNSYISVQTVPVGVDITNTDYWLLTYQFNAQYGELQTQVASATQASNAATNAANKASADVATLTEQVNGNSNTIESLTDSVNNNTTAINGIKATSVKGQYTFAQLNALSTAQIIEALGENGGYVYTTGNTTAGDGGSKYLWVNTAQGSKLGASNFYALELATNNEGGSGEDYSGDISAINSTLNRIDINSNSTVICIGDSFLQGYNGSSGSTSANWGSAIGAITGAQVYSYADGGIGFATNGQNTGAPFSAMVSSITSEHSSADVIIIGGGYNDCIAKADAANINSGANNLINGLREAYPQAEIYIFLNLWGNSNASDKQYTRNDEVKALSFKNAMAQRTDKPVNVVLGCWTWFWGNTDNNICSTDGVHLMAQGYQMMGNYMVQTMKGVDCTKMYTLVMDTNTLRITRNYLDIVIYSAGLSGTATMPIYCTSTYTAACLVSTGGVSSCWQVNGRTISRVSSQTGAMYGTIFAILGGVR